MSQTAVADNYQLEQGRFAKGRNVLVFAVLVSLLACVAGYIQDPARFARSYLVAFAYTTAIGLGAFFFVMVQYLTGSAWSVTVRRLMENIMITLPVGAILFLPIAFLLKSIYPWTDPAVVAAAEAIEAKAGYLTENMFVLRAYIFFALWTIWTFSIYRQSTKQDSTHNIRQMHIISRWSAPGLLLLFMTGTLGAYDWLMSLEPTWYSTIFGLYYLADGGLAFMAVMVLLCLGFQKAGILQHSITKEHYHDLGKWLFALTAFYAYIGFSQFLLIWYANIPEETQFFRHRMGGFWLPWSLSLPFLRFFIPFFALLCRPVKRNLTALRLLAIYSLIVVFLDFYWIVMPVFYPNGPQIHWMDFAALALTVSVCSLTFWGRFKKNKLAPVGDLRFQQGLHFENA